MDVLIRVNWILKLDTNQNIYPLFRLKRANAFKQSATVLKNKIRKKKKEFDRFHGMHQISLYTPDC